MINGEDVPGSENACATVRAILRIIFSLCFNYNLATCKLSLKSPEAKTLCWRQFGSSEKRTASHLRRSMMGSQPAAEVGASAQRKGQCLLTQQQLPGPPVAQEEHRKLTPVSRRATPKPPYYVTPSYKAQWKYCHTYYTSPSRLLWDHTSQE